MKYTTSVETTIRPPTNSSHEHKYQKSWMSPDAELYYLDGLIHEQWARLAIDSDVSAPMPHEGGENAKQKLFECGWVRVALQGTGGLSVEYSDGATLHEKQLSRLITLAIGSGAKFLARECGDKIEVFWR